MCRGRGTNFFESDTVRFSSSWGGQGPFQQHALPRGGGGLGQFHSGGQDGLKGVPLKACRRGLVLVLELWWQCP